MSNIWVEKYRPTTLQQIKGQTHIIPNIQKRINNGGITHYIFTGKAGTGKTTTANAIINELQTDKKEINCSDQRGIDTVRNIIINFCKHASIYNNEYKIIILEEADGLTNDSQRSLKRIIEKYSHNTRFILCVNNNDKIIDEIKSRCKTYTFTELSENVIFTRLTEIAEIEHMDATQDQLKNLSKKCNGDMRKAINNLQNRDFPDNDQLPDFLKT